MSIEEAETEKLDELFSEDCPALGTKVIMLRQTWYAKILNPKTGHPYMVSKQDLVKRAIKSITSKSQFFRLSDYKQNEWFADFACPDFLPVAKALRLAFKRLDNGVTIIGSTYRMPTGVFSYE